MDLVFRALFRNVGFVTTKGCRNRKNEMNTNTKFNTIDQSIAGWIRMAAEAQRLAMMNTATQSKCVCTTESMENSYSVCACDDNSEVFA